VVADEVRTLAGRTQVSTREIQKMIENLQHGTAQAVSVTDRGREQTESNVQQAAKAGEALQNITKATNTTAEMSLQIATASEEQSAVSGEISRKVVNVSQVADKNSEGARESTAAVEQILATIERLDSMVDQFRRKL
jgi:methyl-accepting chemotaxis protein